MGEGGNSALLELNACSEPQQSMTSVIDLSPAPLRQPSALSPEMIFLLLTASSPDFLLDLHFSAAHSAADEALVSLADYHRGLIARRVDIFSPARENVYRAAVSKRPSLDDEDIHFDDV